MAAEPKRTAGGDGLLPLEIWREILSRVPVKSILRCRSVSKAWYSLISCPNFISDYSLRNLNKNGSRVLLQPNPRANAKNVNRGIVRTFPFSSHNESFTESREHDDLPQAFLDSNVWSNVRIVGSCNGLICLCKYEHDDVRARFLIWNPTIRKIVEVPSGSYFSTLYAPAFSYYGFGFDSKTGDYKVMCTHTSYSNKNLCEIFDLKKGVWRRISPPLVKAWDVRGRRTPDCYLDGAAYWSGSTDWRSEKTLLSFHMSAEIFREIRMPDCARFVWNDDDDDSRVETRCVAFGGLIHVIVWKTRTKRENYAVDMYEECSVWAMKEYGVVESWTKLFNIDLLGAEVCERIEPNKFRLWGNGEVLMVHDFSEDEDDLEDEDEEYDSDAEMELVDKQGLLLYNAESGKCKQLFSFTNAITDICLYEESLVLM